MLGFYLPLISVFSKLCRISMYYFCFPTCCVIGNSELMRGFTWEHSVSQGQEGMHLLLSGVLELSLVLDLLYVNFSDWTFLHRAGSLSSNSQPMWVVRPQLEFSGETSFAHLEPRQKTHASLYSSCAGGRLALHQLFIEGQAPTEGASAMCGCKAFPHPHTVWNPGPLYSEDSYQLKRAYNVHLVSFVLLALDNFLIQLCI